MHHTHHKKQNYLTAVINVWDKKHTLQSLRIKIVCMII